MEITLPPHRHLRKILKTDDVIKWDRIVSAAQKGVKIRFYSESLAKKLAGLIGGHVKKCYYDTWDVII